MGRKKKEKEEWLKLWDWFDELAEKNGYSLIIHNDECMGRGTLAHKDDAFAPIIELHIWDDNDMSVHVEDRNGNCVLDGNACAIYSIRTSENFKERFEKMCLVAFEKYGKYSRENRLDFTFNNLKEDRIDWSNVEI